MVDASQRVFRRSGCLHHHTHLGALGGGEVSAIVETENEELIRRRHIEDAVAGGESGVLVAIGPRQPRPIDIDDRVVGEIGRQQELIVPGVNKEVCHAGGKSREVF